MRILTGRSELRTPLEGLPPACRNCRNCHCNCPGCRTTSLTWGSWHRIRREDLASTCRETPCNHLSDSEKQQNGPTAKVELMITYQQNINKISTKYQQNINRLGHPCGSKLTGQGTADTGPFIQPGVQWGALGGFEDQVGVLDYRSIQWRIHQDWGPKDRCLVSPWSGFYIGNFEFTVACPTTVTTGRKFLSSAPR